MHASRPRFLHPQKRLSCSVAGALAVLVALPTTSAVGGGITRTFANPRPIVINDTCPVPTDEACAGLPDIYNADDAPAPPVATASRYPSTIVVPGSAFPTGAKIKDVNVTISSIYHDYLDDVDILLVGPSGQYVMVASNVSAAGGNGGVTAQNLTWIFDDQARLPLPNSNNNDGRVSTRPTNPNYNVIYDEWVGVWTDTTPRRFKPSDYDNSPDTDQLPLPAPENLITPPSVVTHPDGVVTSGPALSVFNGGDPSGTWKLYVVDDFFWFSGEIKGGWSIEITVEDDLSC